MARNNKKTKPLMPAGPEADDHNIDKSVVAHAEGMNIAEAPIELGEPEEPAETGDTVQPAETEGEPEEETEPETTEPADK